MKRRVNQAISVYCSPEWRRCFRFVRTHYCRIGRFYITESRDCGCV